MSQINPTQIVQWLRDHAAKFTKMADDLEITFNSMPGAFSSGPTFQASRNAVPQITVDTIKSTVKLRGMRAKDLADHLKVSEETITLLVKPENRLETVSGGWVRDMDA